MNTTLGKLYLKELEAEEKATRACLEKIPGDLFTWKPHEKSMQLGYMALIVAEIPKWIAHIVTKGEINFATFEHSEAKDGKAFVEYFDANMEAARKALEEVSDEELENGMFYLKNKDVVLMSTPKGESVMSTINHGVHHRGQLTVYMRLNNIPVPSIYGPSADAPSF